MSPRTQMRARLGPFEIIRTDAELWALPGGDLVDTETLQKIADDNRWKVQFFERPIWD